MSNTSSCVINGFNLSVTDTGRSPMHSKDNEAQHLPPFYRTHTPVETKYSQTFKGISRLSNTFFKHKNYRHEIEAL